MKVSSICTYSAVMATTATAFTAPDTNQVRTSLAASSAQGLSELIQLNTLEAEEPSDDRPLYDPLSMYPADAPERRDDRIRPLEAAVPSAGAVDIADPLRLYGNNIGDGAGTAGMSTSTMSRALPFLTRPLHLDGALAGDAGFDPLGLAAASPDRLVFMREAEIKHARLAMLAAAGWVGSELAGGRLSALAASPLLRYGDRVPSLLNGGLGHSLETFFPAFAAVLALAGVVEAFQGYSRRADPEGYAARSIGDLGFDPLGMYGARGDTVQGRRAMEDAELKHGRLAMLAITAFAMQEAFTGVGVVTQVLSWMHPHSAEFLAEGGFASNVQAILSGEY
jgi:hypothetical protein